MEIVRAFTDRYNFLKFNDQLHGDTVVTMNNILNWEMYGSAAGLKQYSRIYGPYTKKYGTTKKAPDEAAAALAK